MSKLLSAICFCLALVGCGGAGTSQGDETEADSALVSSGGSGGGTNFSCNESEGTCTCLGGSLSSDCWLLSQYCTTRFTCSPYYPYGCTCSYVRTQSTGTKYVRPVTGTTGGATLGP